MWERGSPKAIGVSFPEGAAAPGTPYSSGSASVKDDQVQILMCDLIQVTSSLWLPAL